MMQICPAILTNSTHDFTQQLARLGGELFSAIDIDICEERFVGNSTLPFSSVYEHVLPYGSISWGWHLMLFQPEKVVAEIISKNLNSRIYIHQEAEIEFIKDYELLYHQIGIVVKAETALKSLDFYQQFPEVQLMTIQTGKQGNPFIPEVLTKVTNLREMGYSGVISVDGSINLESASLIQKYDINRVSVGSYFAKAENITQALSALDKNLNG